MVLDGPILGCLKLPVFKMMRLHVRLDRMKGLRSSLRSLHADISPYTKTNYLTQTCLGLTMILLLDPRTTWSSASFQAWYELPTNSDVFDHGVVAISCSSSIVVDNYIFSTCII